MKEIFRYFIKNHTLAHLLTVIVFSVGIISLFQLNKDIFPKVTFDRLIVTTIYPGDSPEDVELNVTRKIETELKAVSGLRKFISVSVENKSVIRIEIDPNVSDTGKVKDEVRRAVQRVTDFPEEVIDSPLIVEMKSSELPILEIGLSGDIPYKKLRNLAEVFKKEIISIDGVSRVKGYSYYPREIKIEVSPKKMRKYNISFQEIILAIQGRNIRSTGGSFESYTNEKNIVTLSQFKNPLEVKEVIVKSNFEGKKIRLTDLAEVVDGFEEPRVISTMNGKQAISFVIFKKEFADIIKTTSQIKALVEELKKYYPRKVKFIYANEVANQVKNRFDIVSYNGLIGLILVIIMLTFFLHFSTAFWVSLGIPFSLLGVFAILKIGGFSLDSISMAALIIVIGIIVDDA
ncbi:MAG: efflux RND transporter permease subunit, partial [Deltaproteobacteria bacterium]